MLLFSIIVIPVLFFLAFLFFRFRALNRKSNSIRLFNAALKSENDCQFEKAIGEYETALDEIKRTGRNVQLKTRIIDKIKLLNTVIQYQHGS